MPPRHFPVCRLLAAADEPPRASEIHALLASNSHALYWLCLETPSTWSASRKVWADAGNRSTPTACDKPVEVRILAARPIGRVWRVRSPRSASSSLAFHSAPANARDGMTVGH